MGWGLAGCDASPPASRYAYPVVMWTLSAGGFLRHPDDVQRLEKELARLLSDPDFGTVLTVFAPGGEPGRQIHVPAPRAVPA